MAITIQPAQNGPYLVKGATTVVRNADGKAFEAKGSCALCRCGGSRNKPFCDGTHASNGFKSARSDERLPDKIDHYEGTGISIHDNRGLCAHAGVCTDNLPEVFRIGQEPWIDPDGAEAARVAQVVARCPSGALSYTLNQRLYRDTGDAESISFAPNGPYVVCGAQLEGVDPPQGFSDHCTLCRCGGSKNKPFCDGTHWNLKFDEHAEA